MPKINVQGSGHAGPAPLPGGHQYLEYPSAHPHYLHALKHAIRIIDSRIKSYQPCNDAFKTLPGGLTLLQVWNDPNVWINFDPSLQNGDYGATRGKEVTITAFSLRAGYWTVAATLVHELAHVNGASGTTHDAEGTLRSCLLKNLENPSIIGSIVRASGARIA
jgi:hypothetical protein